MSQRFVELIMMLAEQSVMLLGLQPHPATGQTMRNPKAARIYIDQLEMIREKTRGNLSPEESRILNKMLGDLQYEYVRISGDLTAYDTSANRVEEEEAPAQPASAQNAPSASSPAPAPAKPAAPASPAPAAASGGENAESARKVRFTKSYG